MSLSFRFTIAAMLSITILHHHSFAAPRAWGPRRPSPPESIGVELQTKKITGNFSGSVIPRFNRYLQMPEYLNSWPRYSANFPTFYPTTPPPNFPDVEIDANEYEILVQTFLATYKKKSPHIQKILVPEGSHIVFMGDLHGSIHALIRMLCKLMAEGFLNSDLTIKKENGYMVFLGDFVDYGCYGADTLAIMMLLRVKNQDRVLACRGNHEDATMNIEPNCGFKQELQHRYGEEDATSLYESIQKVFDSLPLAIFLGIQRENPQETGFVQCCHGGISQKDSNNIKTLLSESQEMVDVNASDIPRTRSAFQWCDFTGKSCSGSSPKKDRGVQYDIEGTRTFLADHNIKYIFRGHQDMEHACKNLVRNIENPVCLVPTTAKEEGWLAPYSEWLREKEISLAMLKNTGLILGELPDFIGPVFTFTNASAAKITHDEGFGYLEVGASWETSRLKFHIDRPEILAMNQHLAHCDTARFPAALQDYVKPQPSHKKPILPQHILELLCSISCLPRYTHIGADGNASIGLTVPADQINDGIAVLNARVRHSPEHVRTIFNQIIDYFKLKDSHPKGVVADFERNLSTPAAAPAADAAGGNGDAIAGGGGGSGSG